MQALSFFPIQKFRFTIRAWQPIALPHFAGYQIHGILGDYLMPAQCRAALGNKEQPCKTCPRRPACGFAYLYKPDARHIPDGGTKEEYPRPYIIDPSPVPAGGIGRNELYEFDITLIGRAVHFISEIIAAFLAAGQSGVFGIKGKSAEFDLVSVDVEQAGKHYAIFRNGRMDWLTYQPVNASPVKPAPKSSIAAISLLTPWRIKEKGNLVEIHLLFSLITKSLVTRICDLYLAYICDQEYLLELAQPVRKDECPFGKKIKGCPSASECEDLKQKAQDVILVDQQTNLIAPHHEPFDLDKWKKMGGLVGGVTYRGDMQPFMSILQLGTHVHAGKLAMQGYGKYSMEC
ncbi:MAG: CRISPR system precrRNA processing endoribonuclease RAMP protein Cas6 [Deltaproteobacteria bacterium]|nr:CRISPR system precrRNA processing endoribonuclease RAMP protein Cas6 [Deltaproteobacteria bacterium]